MNIDVISSLQQVKRGDKKLRTITQLLKIVVVSTFTFRLLQVLQIK